MVDVMVFNVSEVGLVFDEDKIDDDTAISGRVTLAMKIKCPLICEMSTSVSTFPNAKVSFNDMGLTGYFAGLTSL